MSTMSKFARIMRIVAYIMSLTLMDIAAIEEFLSDKNNSLKKSPLKPLTSEHK